MLMEAPVLERVQSFMSTASGISLDGQEEKEKEEPKKKEKEPSFFHVPNPSRLTPSQRRFIQWPPLTAAELQVQQAVATEALGPASMDLDLADHAIKTIGDTDKEKALTESGLLSLSTRYSPVDKRSVPAGIVMLIDTDPDAPENVVKVERVGLNDAQEEAEPFEPFEWDPNADE